MHLNILPAETLAPIRARFLVALREREARIGAAARSSAAEHPEALLDDVHKIRGVAPMLGLSLLGALAADAEDRLEAWFGGNLAPAGVLLAMPDDLRLCLKALHGAICEALA